MYTVIIAVNRLQIVSSTQNLLGPSAQKQQKTSNTMGDTTLIVKPPKNFRYREKHQLSSTSSLLHVVHTSHYITNLLKTSTESMATVVNIHLLQFLLGAVSQGNCMYQQLGSGHAAARSHQISCMQMASNLFQVCSGSPTSFLELDTAMLPTYKHMHQYPHMAMATTKK